MREKITCAGCPYAYKLSPTAKGYLCRHPQTKMTRPIFGRPMPKACPACNTMVSMAFDWAVERKVAEYHGVTRPLSSSLSAADREFLHGSPGMQYTGITQGQNTIDFGAATAQKSGSAKKKAATGAGRGQKQHMAAGKDADAPSPPDSFTKLIETAALLQNTQEWEAEARESILGNVFDGASGWCVAVIAGVMAKHFGPMLGLPEWFLARTDMVCNIVKAVCALFVTAAVIKNLLYIFHVQTARQKLEVEMQLGLAKTGYAWDEVERELERRRTDTAAG